MEACRDEARATLAYPALLLPSLFDHKVKFIAPLGRNYRHRITSKTESMGCTINSLTLSASNCADDQVCSCDSVRSIVALSREARPLSCQDILEQKVTGSGPQTID